MFDVPIEERFDAAMKLLGFDPLMLGECGRPCPSVTLRRAS